MIKNVNYFVYKSNKKGPDENCDLFFFSSLFWISFFILSFNVFWNELEMIKNDFVVDIRD